MLIDFLLTNDTALAVVWTALVMAGFVLIAVLMTMLFGGLWQNAFVAAYAIKIFTDARKELRHARHA